MLTNLTWKLKVFRETKDWTFRCAFVHSEPCLIYSYKVSTTTNYYYYYTTTSTTTTSSSTDLGTILVTCLPNDSEWKYSTSFYRNRNKELPPR